MKLVKHFRDLDVYQNAMKTYNNGFRSDQEMALGGAFQSHGSDSAVVSLSLHQFGRAGVSADIRQPSSPN